MVNAVTAAVRRAFRHSSERAIGTRVLGWPLVAVSLPALSLALLASNTGYAQEAAASKAEPASSEPIGEVTVTGSRLSSVSGFNTPTPVTAVDAQQLSQMAAGPLIQALSTLPQFDGNQTQQNIGFPSSGGTNLNLRGAGANRTLVLLDGRRMTASNRYGLVDVAAFPESLVKSVETVTGGASATYGSDAVAGVVNYILDTNFTGFQAKFDGGETEYGDGKNWSGSLAGGMKIGERGHLLLSGDIFRQDPIDSVASLKDRNYLQQYGRVTNAAAPNGPTQVIEPYVQPTNFSNTGVLLIPKADGGYYNFASDGSAAPESFSGVGNEYSGCSCQAVDHQTYGVNGTDQISPGQKRASLFAYFDYDIGENTNLYAQALYGNSSTNSRPTGITLVQSWGATIFSGNPFLPANVQALLDKYNLKSVGFGFLGAQDPSSPVGDLRTIQYNDTYTGTLGFKTKLSTSGLFGFLDGWNWDGYAQHGEAVQDQKFTNGPNVENLPLGLDAVKVYNGQIIQPSNANWANGNIECYATAMAQAAGSSMFNNCAPVNLFGGVQNISSQAAGYITDQEKDNWSLTYQDVAETNLSGKVADGFGAGPISLALGGSFMRTNFDQHVADPTDEYSTYNDGTELLLSSIRGVVPCGTPTYSTTPISATNLSGCAPYVRVGSVPTGYLGTNAAAVIQFSATHALDGGYSVKEFYGEMGIPLLANAPFVRSLDLDIAGRFAHYTESGGIWAYKAGLNWQITDDLRFRGTYSRDIRAASLLERFDSTSTGASVTDPLTGNAVSAYGRNGGNPELNPEKADTITLGFVWQPAFVPGLQTSLDYYSIKIKDAIAQLSAQNLVNECAASGYTGSICQYIERDTGLYNSGNIIRIDQLYINLSNQKIQGMDLETRYHTPITLLGGGPESLMLSLYGGWLNTNSITTPGSPEDNSVGSVEPRFKLNASVSYTNGPINVYVQERWISNMLLDRTYVQSSVAIPGVLTISNNHVPATPYTDLHVTYSITSGGHDWQIYGNITNLLNRDPPVTAGSVGRGGVSQTNSTLYDVVGRRFLLGAKFQF